MEQQYNIGDRIAFVKDNPYVDNFRDKDGNPAIAQVISHRRPDLMIQAVVLTGPEKGAEVMFKQSEVEPSIKVLSVKRATFGSVKLYGKVLGEKGKTYSFGYIRHAYFRGWVCSCEDFLYNRVSKKQNCKHLRCVRVTLGRYGAKWD
jgi:hypothetical protein